LRVGAKEHKDHNARTELREGLGIWRLVTIGMRPGSVIEALAHELDEGIRRVRFWQQVHAFAEGVLHRPSPGCIRLGSTDNICVSVPILQMSARESAPAELGRSN